jgi:hypothetical protein
MGPHGDASKGFRHRPSRRGSNKESSRLGDVDSLPRGTRKDVKRSDQISHGSSRQVGLVDLSVISVLGADVPLTGYRDTQPRLSTQPRAKGLGDEEVEEGREGAPLPDASMPGHGG